MAGGLRHTFHCPMRWSDMDAYGHVNNVVYLTYLEEARVDMLFTIGAELGAKALSEGVLVARHEIDYRKPAFDGDELTVRTWVGVPSGATWERFTEIRRAGELVVSARTDWVLIDAPSGRPRRIDPTWTAWLTPPPTNLGTPPAM